MAISYPLELPTTIGIASIELRTVNANATSQSPFTYKQQILSYGGQRFEASVTIPPVKRDLAAAWKASLVSLKGSLGTFLLGDTDPKHCLLYTSPSPRAGLLTRMPSSA